MTRKVYAYWYKDEPLYHWCKNNNISYSWVMELIYKGRSIEDAVEYVKERQGKKVIKYEINGVSVRQLLGPYKYTLFNGRVHCNKKHGKNIPWEEVYKKLSTV